MITADAVTLAIGTREILRDVSVALPSGAVSVIIGPNGAGKSTLMRALSGELKPSRGVVRFDRRDIGTVRSIELAARRAVMPQATLLAFPFRVEEVVALGASIPAFGNPRESDIVNEAMALASVDHLVGRDYTRLSGGERQRVHFARAICQLLAGGSPPETTALLLDEPTSSLDLPHQMLLMECAHAEAAKGRTVVAVLHDLNLAVTWADQIIAVGNGGVVAVGAPREVLTAERLTDLYQYPIPVSLLDGLPGPAILPQHMRQG